MITSHRLVLRTLTARDAERTLTQLASPAPDPAAESPGIDTASPTAESSAASPSAEPGSPAGTAGTATVSTRQAFADGYPSTFATQVMRLVALYPAIDQWIGAGGPDLGPWLVVRSEDDTAVGMISCARRADPGDLSVGYDIASSCQGEGYATEALGAVVEHLLSQPGVSRVSAETDPGHTASRRVMEKAGMRWQGDETAGEGDDQVTLTHYAIDRPAPL